ncbi:hypothetical protein SAMN05443544_1785 [Agromyces cerinus subsp. cerinus]|uniref:Capsular polysaccharide biosynthesis protein n=1 Tax=Agromyces cerinus subsp. cerinus TaxID=232089 RepID=A0A1N6F6D7_9MICO|nr:hypothetical protein SAMN05443544_1785 [Agromyces cerinus subsp. cerinus]
MTDFLRAMGRRWYVLIVGLIATAGLGYAAVAMTPPEYTARGLVLLLPSQDVVGKGGNPFLAMGDLGLPASILAAYFQSSSVQAQVAELSPEAKYSVAIEASTRGPLMSIDVTDVTADGALTTLDYLAGAIPSNLERLQQEVGAPSASTVTSMPLTMDSEATEHTDGTIRMMIVAVAVGLLGTVTLTFTIDRLILRRAQRRRDDALQSADAADVTEGDEGADAAAGAEGAEPADGTEVVDGDDVVEDQPSVVVREPDADLVLQVPENLEQSR